MSSSGPPPAAPTFEASKCALIMARAVASVIENPPRTDAARPGAAVAPRRPHRDPTPTPRRCKLVDDAPIGERTPGPVAAPGAPRARLTGAGPACACL